MSKAQRPIANLTEDAARIQSRQIRGLGNTASKNFTARSAQVLTVVPDDTQFGITIGSSACPRVPQFAIRNNAGTFSLYVRVAQETRVAGVVTVLGTWKSVALA